MSILEQRSGKGVILHCNMDPLIPIDQLAGRHARLRLELFQAFRALSFRTGEIERIAEDLAQTERQISAVRPVDEQTGDSLLGFAW